MRIVALISLDRAPEALAQARRLRAAQPGDAMAAARLIESLAANGEIEAGARLLDESAALFAGGGATHLARAHFHVLAGQDDAAWDAAEAACAAHECQTETLGVHPYFTRLRADPRWPGFARRHRLPALADASP